MPETSEATQSLGAFVTPQGTRFRIWAPNAQDLQLVIAGQADRAMTQENNGYFSALVENASEGTRYGYRVNQRGPFPDPTSRFQPDGVHGLSQVVEPSRFVWTDRAWKGIPREKLSIYELHVGTFTAEGTFSGVQHRLHDLLALGVNAIELMPVNDFPGQRNWGYDGVALYAPARIYGKPDDLRRLIDAAHSAGLAVLVDVVYNHLGPDGNYLGVYSASYFSDRHHTPWGAAVNLDGPHCAEARRFFLDNALMWLGEYHADGLRIDATHALLDDSPRHFLAELSDVAHAAFPQRKIHLIAEDHRNLAHEVRPTQSGGWGMDAVWSDDFHHEVRRALAGDHEGYYQDFSGRAADIAVTARQGWFFTGQPSTFMKHPRGTHPTGLDPASFVFFLQNHDQIGNRALGERLHHQIDPSAYRAASALFLSLPHLPLLFMGQEWGASSPFLFFTDHTPELGEKVVKGRREEFKVFSAFADVAARMKIPDPQSQTTFERSRLHWNERHAMPYAGFLKLYQRLFRMRKDHPAFQSNAAADWQIEPIADHALRVERRAKAARIGVAIQLKGSGQVRWPGSWHTLWTTEDAELAEAPKPPTLESNREETVITFQRPGAVFLETTGS